MSAVPTPDATLARLAAPVRGWRLAASLTLTVLLLLAPLPVEPSAQRAVAIAAGLALTWATEAVPIAVAGIVGIAAFWVSGAAPASVVLSGFWNSSLWLLLGALTLGLVAGRTGLAQRLAIGVAIRSGGSYSGLLLTFIIVDLLLTFFVPSGTARVAILGTIVVGLVDALGLPRRDPVARALMVTVTYTATIFDKMILAGAASILASGIIADVSGVRVSYGLWLLAFLPCHVLTVLACWRAMLWLFPAPSRLAGSADYLAAEAARLGPWSGRQSRAALILGAAALLWVTDVLHGIEPATVAVVAAGVALLPGVGVLRLRDLTLLRLDAVVFLVAALGSTAVLVRSHGLDLLTDMLIGWAAPLLQGPVLTSQVLYWTAFAYHLVLGSEISMVSATLPAVMQFTQTAGLSPLPIGLIWTFGSGGKLFAYQSTVLVTGYAFGIFEARDLMRVGLLLTIVEALILLALVPLYWPLIGIQ